MTVSKFLACALLALSPACASDLLIRNVTVIAVDTGRALPHSSILIHGDRIRSVGPSVHAPRGTRIVNATGKYVIPGLWDMHVHLWYKQNQLPQYLAWGVTGVRDMGSDLERVKRWRAAALAPHVETAGPPVDGGPSADPRLPVIVVRTPEEARDAYDELEQKLKVDFVKVLSRLPRDSYFALLERARQWGMQVAGHVPESVTVEEAVDARQDSIEHLSGVLLACSRDEAAIRAARAEAIQHNDRAALNALASRTLSTFSDDKAQTLLERMARFECYQVPTLVMLRRMTHEDDAQLARDPHLKYVPLSIRKIWDDPREEKKKLSSELLELLHRQYEMACTLVVRMQAVGVPLMAGTDTGDPFTFPGLDLHRELRLLVDAGLTPLQALRAATLTPAKYLDADESLGTIAPGKIADLVLLTADPLEAIDNTRTIAAVILGGKYLTRARLNSMLAAASDAPK